jgi:acetolactate synthase-1/2/3 large subunit
MLQLEAADLLLAYLEQIGVDTVFGIIGGAIEPLYAALARHARAGGSIRHVSARHEAGAALMAEGYARETGKLGVCCATSGPGATNLITGVADAYCNEIPMLVLTGQPALPLFGRDAFQESSCTGIDIPAMFRPITRYNSLVSHPSQFETKLVRAMYRAHQMPYGPVHLSLPMDILSASIDASGPSVDLLALLKPKTLVNDRDIAALNDELDRAESIVIVLGPDAAHAVRDILLIAEHLHAKVVVTPDAKGLINTRHPFYCGVIGFGGHPEAMQALADAPDLVLSIGARFGEWNGARWNPHLFCDRMIHVDACSDHFGRVLNARMHVAGDVATVMRRLLEARDRRVRVMVPRAEHVMRMEVVASTDCGRSQVHPAQLMRTLSSACPSDARIVADTGNSAAWAIHAFDTIENAGTASAFERPWLHVAMEFATMGWAIGVAVGIARGNRDVPAVCITGDGSYLMSGQEITVAQEEGLCVVFVVLNDGALGMVKHNQVLNGAEQFASDLPAVNFKLMAESLGIPGYAVRNQRDLESLPFEEIFSHKGPTLLDIHIDRQVAPPFRKKAPK